MPLKSRVRDLALYITIGLAVVLSMVVWIFFVPARFHFPVNLTWLRFGWLTVLVWCMLAKAFWHVRRSAALWLILAVSLIVHTAVYAFLFQLVEPWPWISYLFTLPAEGMAITYMVSKCLKVLPRYVGSGSEQHKRHGGQT